MEERKKIVIAGGTGLIGSRLIDFLAEQNYEVCILTRSDRKSHKNISYSKWDPNSGSMDGNVLSGANAIINLAGAGIADKKWTTKRKEILISSRVNSCKTLSQHISKLENHLPFYFGASAIGLYGDRQNEKLTTESNRGEGFLADVTDIWEKANQELSQNFKRHVILRIGIVLSTKGGALKEILKPANAGVYGYFGNGKAYYSWIHIDDICKIIIDSIHDDSFNGIYNGTSPEPAKIYNLVKAVKNAKNGLGVLMPVPKFGLKLVMGEMADMLFNSTRVIPNRLISHGFEFEYSNLDKTMKNLIDSGN